MIRALFFGKLQDLAGTGTADVEPHGITSVADVAASIESAYPAFAGTLCGDSVRSAVNGELAGDKWPVQDGDEVAFLPPVSGG